MDSSSAEGANFGDNKDVCDHRQMNKKCYHRYTTRQIQELERMFKECPHPDEKLRLQLSIDFGLEPCQIKLWFENKRAQTKAQQEHVDNWALRQEYERLRCENIAIIEAIQNFICPYCGGSLNGEDVYFDKHELQIEYDRVKEELSFLTEIIQSILGRH